MLRENPTDGVGRVLSRGSRAWRRGGGDTAIIVQIKEDVDPLSFASRIMPGNIQRRREKLSDDFCAKGSCATNSTRKSARFCELNAAYRMFRRVKKRERRIPRWGYV